jgi:tetratricopeptide (TPR) repeat protein
LILKLNTKRFYVVQILVALLLTALFSFAHGAGSNKEPAKSSKKTVYLPKQEHQLLKEVQAEIDSDQLEKAKDKITKFNETKASPLAKALSQQLLGVIYQTQLKYPLALDAYQKAISHKGLPLSTKVALFEKIHKLNYFIKDWQQVVFWWLKWEKRAKPQAQDYMLLSSAYRYQKKWALAKKALIKALAINKRPPQLWYQLLLEYEEQLKNIKGQQKLLRQLVESYPQNESYWLKLGKVYIRSGKSEQANALLLSAFNAGVLQQSKSIQWLIKALASQRNYIRAIEVLDGAVAQKYLQPSAVLERQAIAYLMHSKAYERALKRLQNNIDQQPNFDVDGSLARLNFALKHWRAAYQAAVKLPESMTKSSIQWQLILGVSSAHIGENNRAKKHLSEVLIVDSGNSVAEFWMSQL